MDGLFGIVRSTGADNDSTTPIHAAGWAKDAEIGGLRVAGAAHVVDRSGLGFGTGDDPLQIVAQLYRRHGIDAFRHLHGQFCLAVEDQSNARLVLATDRFMTRPIYYTETGGDLVWGTCLSAVAAASQRTDVDEQAVLEYFLYRVVPTPRSIYARVCKLAPGHRLVVERSSVRIAPYWDVTYAESRNGSAPTWARETRQAIENTLRRYVEAEESPEEVGAFLSGGTDSSTVAGMMARLTAERVPTFSIGYAEQGYDELSYARTSASWFGTQHHEWKLTAHEALKTLPRIARYCEEPFGNSSVLPTYACASLAAQHGVRVLFAGDGGDEIFAGNERYATNQVFSIYQSLPSWLRRPVADPLVQSLPDGLPVLGRARRYVRRSNIPNPRRFFSYHFLLSQPLAQILSPEFLHACRPTELLDLAEEHFHRPDRGTSELNRLMYLDLKLTIADNDVRKVSGMAELAGMEVRYPFLDADLVEFSGRIPTRLKLNGLRKRYIFKRALADFLPPQVLTKPKHGFGTPVALWMRTDPQWRDFVGDLLHDTRTRERGYVRTDFLDRIWSHVQRGEASYYGDSLWPLLMLELWHRQAASGPQPREQSPLTNHRIYGVE